MQRNSRGTNRLLVWVVPLAAGFLTVILIYWIYRAANPHYPRHILNMAHEMAIRPRDAAALDRLHLKVADGAAPTAAEWQTVSQFAQSGNTARRRFALRVLRGLYKSKYRHQAVTHAVSLAHDIDPGTQAIAISVLAHLHDPRWRELALRNQSSPDPILRNSAVTLLEREARFR